MALPAYNPIWNNQITNADLTPLPQGYSGLGYANPWGDDRDILTGLNQAGTDKAFISPLYSYSLSPYYEGQKAINLHPGRNNTFFENVLQGVARAMPVVWGAALTGPAGLGIGAAVGAGMGGAASSGAFNPEAGLSGAIKQGLITGATTYAAGAAGQALSGSGETANAATSDYSLLSDNTDSGYSLLNETPNNGYSLLNDTSAGSSVFGDVPTYSQDAYGNLIENYNTGSLLDTASKPSLTDSLLSKGAETVTKQGIKYLLNSLFPKQAPVMPGLMSSVNYTTAPNFTSMPTANTSNVPTMAASKSATPEQEQQTIIALLRKKQDEEIKRTQYLKDYIENIKGLPDLLKDYIA